MGSVCKLVKNYEVRDFAIDLRLVQPAKVMWEAYVGSSNDSSVKGISRVARNLANLWLDSRDARPAVYVCFPHFFTHTYEIVRRVSEKKIWNPFES